MSRAADKDLQRQSVARELQRLIAVKKAMATDLEATIAKATEQLFWLSPALAVGQSETEWAQQRENVRQERLARQARAIEEATERLTSPLIARLVTIAKLPQENRDQFEEFLCEALAREIDHFSPHRMKLRVSQKDASAARKAAYACMKAFRASEGLETMHRGLIAKLEQAIKRHPSPLGRKRTEMKHPRFMGFVIELIDATLMLGGGFTIARKRGSLVDAFNELRPVFPDGFVPATLPFRRLEAELQRAKRSCG